MSRLGLIRSQLGTLLKHDLNARRNFQAGSSSKIASSSARGADHPVLQVGSNSSEFGVQTVLTY